MDIHEQSHETASRRFRISVAGRLDEHFIVGLENIDLGHGPDGSWLDGVLIDQSQFRGVLDRLWQLGIEVLGFETYLPESETPST